MPRKEFTESGYVSMYLFVAFDLPVDDKKKRKEYTKFRKKLLKNGFEKFQYSVYMRYCEDAREEARCHDMIRKAVPEDGMVSVIAITTRQFEKIVTYVGGYPEPSPEGQCLVQIF